MNLILASSNQHKLLEIKQLLPRSINLLSLSDIGWDQEIEETGQTFKENAEIKAKAVFEKTGQSVLADDSGLEVEELNGAPGVFSARYAGKMASDFNNNQRLLQNMLGKQNRRANFSAVLCLYLAENQIFFFEGKVYGTLTVSPQGENGFGYDPLFIPDGYDITFAQLPVEVKNEISHRAKAISKFLAYFKSYEG